MNTAQLIVLWYAGLLVSAIFYVIASNNHNPIYLIVAIAVISIILIYSLRPNPAVKKRKVIFAVAIPIITILIIIGSYIAYESNIFRLKPAERPAEAPAPEKPTDFESYVDEIYEKSLVSIPTEQVDLVNSILEGDGILGGDISVTFKGRIRNRSSYILKSIPIEIIIYEGKEIVERKEIYCKVDISPGESQYVSIFIRDNFTTPLFKWDEWKIKFYRDKRFHYEYRVLSAKGIPVESK